MADRFREITKSFFISTALINLAMLILGKLFRPDQSFGYEVFAYPLIYGALACIPLMIVRQDSEMSVRQMIIRKILSLALIIAILLTFIFAGSEFSAETVGTALAVAVSIAVIFVSVHAIEWFLDAKTAREMTEDLRRFQENRVE